MGVRILQSIIDIIRGKRSLEGELLEITWLRKKIGVYGQYGEDWVISRLLKRKNSNLFYIDIGAHKPTEYSNTKYFYDRGSRGINIEANPELIEEFYKQRPEDINLNVGVTATEGEMPFYILEKNSLVSTFSKTAADDACEEYNVGIKSIVNIKTYPLTRIIEDYAKDKTIDFLSVDAEGIDFEVLKSNDWKKYRPRLVMVEIIHNKDIIPFMLQNNYKIAFKNYFNYIFIDKLNKKI